MQMLHVFIVGKIKQYNLLYNAICTFAGLVAVILKLSVIRQKAESQNGCFKKAKQAKFFEKRTFLTS